MTALKFKDLRGTLFEVTFLVNKKEFSSKVFLIRYNSTEGFGQKAPFPQSSQRVEGSAPPQGKTI